MTTEFGKELRKIRIDHDERLIDMARRIEKSSAFISSVEVGKKSPPAGFEKVIARLYRLGDEAAERLSQAADRARKSFTLEPKSMLSRDTVGLFARRLERLSDEQMRRIKSVLEDTKE